MQQRFGVQSEAEPRERPRRSKRNDMEVDLVGGEDGFVASQPIPANYVPNGGIDPLRPTAWAVF